MELGFHASEHGAATVLSVSGDIDLYTAPQLFDRLVELSDDGAQHLVVDLETVEFLDSSALGALVGVQKHVAGRGGTLKIVTSNPRIINIFAVTRLAEVVPTFDTVQAATTPS